MKQIGLHWRCLEGGCLASQHWEHSTYHRHAVCLVLLLAIGVGLLKRVQRGMNLDVGAGTER